MKNTESVDAGTSLGPSEPAARTPIHEQYSASDLGRTVEPPRWPGLSVDPYASPNKSK